ncbi:MAG TPA: glycosyltransferase family 2 protein [Thermoanaerobaculia bacterium]|nr:glycosyltransferase family 2 protein [Thermoanaerobaculia bacterium]
MATAVAVVVVSFNTRDLLRACLESVRAELGGGSGELVVVDNASTDGSAGMVREEFPEARLLANDGNPGFGAAANQGLAACRSPYAMLLNGDTWLRPGALAALARYLDENPRAGIVGPRLLNPDGTLQPSCYPFLTPFNFLALNSGLMYVVRFLRRFRPTYRGVPSRAGHWVKGAALAIRREAFAAVAGFDEGYFMYAEELDLCWRALAAGWEVHYTPVASVVHVEGASTSQARHEMAALLFASLERFYRKHHRPASLSRLRRVVVLILLQRIGRDVLKFWRYPERRPRLSGDLLLWRRLLLERL